MSPEVAPQGLRLTFPLTLALTCYCPAYVALVPWATVFPSPFSAWFSPAEAQGRAESLFHDCPLELPGTHPRPIKFGIFRGWDPSVNVF